MAVLNDLGLRRLARVARVADLAAQEAQLRVAVYFIVAIGQQQQEWLGSYPPGKGDQKLKATIIAPMNIFDDDQGRAWRALEEACKCLKETPFLQLWVKRGCSDHSWQRRSNFRE